MLLNSKLYVRSYRSADLEQVHSLISSIFQLEYKDISPKKFLSDLNKIAEIYRGDREGFWVCEKDKKIIGTIAIKQDEEKVALLRRFFVNPNFRGEGFGKMLLKQALEFAKTKNYEKVIFMGNFQMIEAKKILMHNSFEEDENFSLDGGSLFKLCHTF